MKGMQLERNNRIFVFLVGDKCITKRNWNRAFAGGRIEFVSGSIDPIHRTSF